MKLELDGKFITSFRYELPQETPDNIEYEISINLEMINAEEGSNIIEAAFNCSLFNDESNIQLKLRYVFYFRHDEENIIEKQEKELAHNLFLICVPYISEFIDYIISKSPLPPLNITYTELSN